MKFPWQGFLDPEADELEHQRQLCREIRTAAAALGWFPEDVDKFVVAIFDHKLPLCSLGELEFLIDRFNKGLK